MTLFNQYALRVHKSMHQPDLLLGIPKMVFTVILVLTIIMIYLFNFWFVLTGIILYLPCYFISKEDPHLLPIAIESLFEIDFLEG